MKNRKHRRISALLRVIGISLALAPAACAPAVTWREPVSLADRPQAALGDANALTRRMVHLALPVGWTFRESKQGDPKGVLFWLADGGSNTVSGVVRYTHFDFEVSGQRLSSVFAEKGMLDFTEDREIRKTEIDGKEAYLVQGTKAGDGHQRLTALILMDSRNVLEITLITDPGYLTRSLDTAYGIVNSYQFAPKDTAERHIKGALSFKCNDGSLLWINDIKNNMASNGFNVYGSMSEGYFIFSARQVRSPRLADHFKKEFFTTPEFDTELHLAGRTYPAHAVGLGGQEGKSATLALFFKHEDQDYIVEVYRGATPGSSIDVKNLHNDETVRRALDTYFYFDGEPAGR